jgi:hypothetical protein
MDFDDIEKRYFTIMFGAGMIGAAIGADVSSDYSPRNLREHSINKNNAF